MPPTVVPWVWPNLSSLASPWFDPVIESRKALAPYCSKASRLHGHTKRKGFLGPRSGTIRWEHRDHLAQSVKASYRQHLLKPRGWLGSWVDLVSASAAASNKSTCLRPKATGDKEQAWALQSLARSWTSRWSSFPATTGNPTCSTAPSHVLLRPCPLETSNLFQLESEHPLRKPRWE